MENHPEYIISLCREMRKLATTAEDLLWRCLRDRQLGGLKFRRQHPIGRYIADFYCHKLKLIIEVDGAVHHTEDQERYDKVRDEFLRCAGYRTLRFTNTEVTAETETVLIDILCSCDRCPHP